MNLQNYSFKQSLIAAAFLALLVLYGYYLFYHLGQRAYIDWDESIYAQVSKEALQNNDYFSFTFFGNNWFEKPPLMIWLTAVGFKIFGINELGGRFFVAVFAFLTIVLTTLVVKKLTKSTLASFLTLLSFSVCSHFFIESYFLEFNIVVGFFILLSIYAFVESWEKPKYLYLFFLSIALGVLAKSVVGLIPLLIIFFYSLLLRNFSYLKNKHFWYGALLSFLVIAPWHILETLKFGKTFWDTYFFYHVFDRFSKPLENNGAPFNYYFSVFTQNEVFAVLSLISAAYLVVKSWKEKHYLLLLIGSIIIFLFFSLAQTKGTGYIVVIYPFVLAMWGITLVDLLAKSPYKLLTQAFIVIVSFVFLALGLQQQSYKIFRLEEDPNYEVNKTMAEFIKTNYPGKPVFGGSWAEANLAFSYYMGRAIQTLPAKLPPGMDPPPQGSMLAQYRVYHQTRRSVYNLPNYLLIAP